MKTAWYIDDDQDMIQAISLMIGLLDFEVKPFLNARTAAGELQFSQPDLLILDINMPEVSGIDMLEFVRRKPEFDHLPIVMLSSEHTDAQVEEALGKGADAYVLKPATMEELEKAISRAFSKRTGTG
jgi:two-component system alkaline phosphatase synthesis response regulator PhoP